jgi:integrase
MPYAASLRIRPTAKGVSYDVRYRVDGQQKTKGFGTQAAANAWKRLLQQHGPEYALSWLDQDSVSEKPTVADYAELYISSKSGVEGKTLDHYRMFVQRSIGPFMGHLPLDAVTPEVVSAWVNEQSAPTVADPLTGKLPRALAAKTIKNRHGFLYAMFNHAIRRGIINRNPCDGTNMPSTERLEMVFLNPDEFTALLGYVPEFYKPLILLLAGTGLRWSEATALRHSDFDLEAGLLRVSRAWKDSKAKGKYLGAPKTTRSRRTVALPPGLVQTLRPLVEQRGEFVFLNPKGQPILQQSFYKEAWDPARRLANGLPAVTTKVERADDWTSKRGGFSWPTPATDETRIHKLPRIHDLRHTHASWLINAGMPLPVIQNRLGHESITTTVDRYGHLSPDNLNLAAQVTQVAMAGALPELE